MIRIIIIETGRAWEQGTQTDIVVCGRDSFFGRHRDVTPSSYRRIMRMAASQGWRVERE